MTVYVESNFVLEIALGQEQADAAQSLLEQASRGEIALALPTSSLSEPFSTITLRTRGSERLRNRLSDHIRQLSRSVPHRADVLGLESAPAFLATIETRELERIISIVGQLYSVAIVLPIDASIYAEATGFMQGLELSPQDAMIYAAILAHLRTGTRSGPHYFINRNWRDFDDSRIVAQLGALDCRFLRSFDEAVLSLEHGRAD